MADTDLSRLTIGKALDRQAQRHAEREFIAYADRDARWTYRAFRDRADLVARGLMAMGVRKAEHVAIWAPNLPEWLLTQFGAARIGAVLVALDPSLRAADLENALRQSEATTLIFGPGGSGADALSIVHEALPGVDDAPVGHGRFEELPRLTRVLSIGKQRYPGMLRFDDLFDLSAQIGPDELRRRADALDAFEAVMIPFTRGTTGHPRGVELTHRGVLVTAWNTLHGLDVGEEDRVVVSGPMSSVFSSVGATLAGMLRGACIVPVERPDARAVLEAIAAERCTTLVISPDLAAAMLAQPELAAYDLSKLRKGIIGGAPVPGDVAVEATQLLGIADLTVGYGLTEASGFVTRSSPADPAGERLDTVGCALPMVQVRIFDPRTGEPASAGAVGELCCRGLGLMKGYSRDPEGTAAAIDGEGWLHTRDLATVDAQGAVSIVGRMIDAIARNGDRIAPREVEIGLQEHPNVADVYVVGVPNRDAGEELCAVVLPRRGQEITADEILAFGRDQLGDEKAPTLAMVVGQIPRSAGGRPLLGAMRNAAIEKFGRQSDAAAKA